MKFNLSTDAVFVKEGYKMQVLTSGMDITEFIDNPLMLSEHNKDKVIGTWKNIEKLEDRIIAEPNFDEDEESVKIQQKVEKGTIKSASIGFEIKDYYITSDDTIVLSKTVLLEASLVGLPANKTAKKLSNGDIMLFSNGIDCNITELFNRFKTKNMNLESEEVKTVDTVIDEVSAETKEETIDSTEEVIEENKDSEDITVPNEVNLSNEISEDKKVISILTEQINNLKVELSNKDTEISNLKASIDSYILEKKELILSNAVNEGKISLESKDSFMELSLEKIVEITDKLSSKNVSISNTIINMGDKGDSKEKSYEWYLKNDKEGLKKLSKDNPTLYKQIESDYIKKLK